MLTLLACESSRTCIELVMELRTNPVIAMSKYRSVVSVILALVAVVFVNFGNAAEAKPKAQPLTYTSEQLETIQGYVNDLSKVRDRLPELAQLIQKQDWIYVRNFIHGPLGEIRATLLKLSRNLLPDAQAPARKAAKAVFDNLVAIDQAAVKGDYKLAIRNYAETIRDLDSFLQLVPQA